MPVLLRLRLIPYRNTPLDTASAPAQGWFFALLSQVLPEVATALHVPNRPRPYTVAPLHTLTEAPVAQEWRDAQPLTLPREAPGGKALAVRVAVADAAIVEPLLAHLAAQPSVPRLAGTPCVLARIPTWGAEDPDVWEIPWPALVAAPPAEQIRLSFVTPTYFTNASNGDDLLFPEPRLLWGSWQRSWRAWCNDAFPLPELDPTHLRVARYALRTEAIRLKGGLQRGFIGDLTLEWNRQATDEERCALAAAAGLANLASTGAGTALGMGQTRAVIVAEP